MFGIWNNDYCVLKQINHCQICICLRLCQKLAQKHIDKFCEIRKNFVQFLFKVFDKGVYVQSNLFKRRMGWKVPHSERASITFSQPVIPRKPIFRHLTVPWCQSHNNYANPENNQNRTKAKKSRTRGTHLVFRRTRIDLTGVAAANNRHTERGQRRSGGGGVKSGGGGGGRPQRRSRLGPGRCAGCGWTPLGIASGRSLSVRASASLRPRRVCQTKRERERSRQDADGRSAHAPPLLTRSAFCALTRSRPTDGRGGVSECRTLAHPHPLCVRDVNHSPL